MSKINNQSNSLDKVKFVRDIDTETAASYSGGEGFLYGRNPDVILYKGKNGTGQSLGLNAATGDGLRNFGLNGSFETTFNDTVSSIRVRRGSWQFWRDSGYRGDTTGLLRPGKLYNLGYNNNELTSAARLQP